MAESLEVQDQDMISERQSVVSRLSKTSKHSVMSREEISELAS